MKKFLPLLASALLLAGCASDDSINPWSTEEERADARVGNAEAAATTSAPTGDATAPTDKYSWQKKAAEAAPEVVKPALKSGKAVVLAIRGDAGLIQIKRTDATAAGDKLVLKKDNKSLLVIVTSSEGETAIANIVAKQLDTPVLSAGDKVACSVFEEKK